MWEPLKSRMRNLYWLKSIFQVYNNALGILKVHFLGGETNVLLHDLQGNRLMIKVTKDNVKRIIKLGKILSRFNAKYEVRDSRIICKPCPSIIRILSPDFTFEELDYVSSLFLLGKYVADVVSFDDNHYLVTDIDGVNWIVRNSSPILLRYDSLFGPLLSCHQEPLEYEWFSDILHEGSIFVDVGANVGGYSVRACKIGARVIAVEPDPDNYHVLKLNLEHNQCTSVNVLNIAAGMREEVRELYEDNRGAPAGFSLLQAKGSGKIKCSVKVKPLDVTIPQLLNNERVDLLKIDVEGVEPEVIKGALDLLKRTRYVIVEVIPSTKSRMLEMLNLLKPLGFKLIDKVCRLSLYCDLLLGKQPQKKKTK
jgi:FkbM family methyltransferase